MNLFDQNNETLDPNTNYLEALVGEGKKFKTVEELARGKAEADLFIANQNKVNDQLREDYLKLRETANAQAKFEDLLSRYEKLPTRPDPSLQLPAEPVQPQPSLDPERLPSLIRQELKQAKIEEKATDNFNQVQNKLKEQFGSNYQSVLQERMNFLGLSEEDVNSLARKSPSAFYNTIGLNAQPESLTAPPRSTTNTAGFRPQGAPKRTWAWYQDLKKKDPATYYSPKTKNQMHDDAIALGTDFQDGDFHA